MGPLFDDEYRLLCASVGSMIVVFWILLLVFGIGL
jgi:hypothetical protein